MKQTTTPAIILRRINYGEADRIVTFLTPKGKLKALVKGVRRSKSKLAGGIELFSESTITFIATRGDLQRIVSTQLIQHWDGIVGDLQRMMFGYEAMKLIDKVIEDEADKSYFEVLKHTLQSLSNEAISLDIVELWFYMRFLKLQGHTPNLETDKKGKKLQNDSLYQFSLDDMCFSTSARGEYRPDQIKLLRLSLQYGTNALSQVKQAESYATPLNKLLQQLTLQSVN